jgi:hypothetical protein
MRNWAAKNPTKRLLTICGDWGKQKGSRLDTDYHQRPQHDGSNDIAGDSQRDEGDHGSARRGVVRRLGSGDARQIPLAEAFRILGKAFCLVICHVGGNGPAGGGDYSNDRTQERRAENDLPQAFEFLWPGQNLADLVLAGHPPQRSLVQTLHLGQDLGNSEKTNQHRHSGKAHKKPGYPEGEALRAQGRIQAHHGEQKAEKARKQAFGKEEEDTLAMMVRPKIMSAKYSEGPNFKAIFASWGARKIRQRVEIIPPAVEATRATPRALPAWPFWVRGYPSNKVAAAEGVPGVDISTAAMEPPNIEPQKKPAHHDQGGGRFDIYKEGKHQNYARRSREPRYGADNDAARHPYDQEMDMGKNIENRFDNSRHGNSPLTK